MVGETLRNLLMIAWLLPLIGFAVEIFGGFWGTRQSKLAAWLAVGCIAVGFLCSASALVIWGNASHCVVLDRGHHSSEGEGHPAHGHGASESGHEENASGQSDIHAKLEQNEVADYQFVSVDEHAVGGGTEPEHEADIHGSGEQTIYSGTIYSLATFGGLELSID